MGAEEVDGAALRDVATPVGNGDEEVGILAESTVYVAIELRTTVLTAAATVLVVVDTSKAAKFKVLLSGVTVVD